MALRENVARLEMLEPTEEMVKKVSQDRRVSRVFLTNQVRFSDQTTVMPASVVKRVSRETRESKDVLA